MMKERQYAVLLKLEEAVARAKEVYAWMGVRVCVCVCVKVCLYVCVKDTRVHEWMDGEADRLSFV